MKEKLLGDPSDRVGCAPQPRIPGDAPDKPPRIPLNPRPIGAWIERLGECLAADLPRWPAAASISPSGTTTWAIGAPVFRWQIRTRSVTTC